MTLRARLVAGLFVLMSVGLAIFGVTMYKLYSGSQYRQLDTDLREAVPLVTQELANKAGVDLPQSITGPGSGDAPNSGYGSNSGYRPGDGGYSPSGGYSPGTNTYVGSSTADAAMPGGAVEGGPPPDHGGSPFLVAPGTYGELLGKSGQPVAHVQLENSTAVPRIPAALLTGNAAKQFVHLGSVSGSTGWLADIGPRLGNGDRVVVALPTNEVTSSLNQLVLIESLGAASLLLILSVGAGFVLRRGLSPLERMADTAKDIAAGDLSQRVEVKQENTEVGELGGRFQYHARRDPAGFLRAGRHRGPSTSIPGRCVARAEDAAHFYPGLRRVVPPQRRQPPWSTRPPSCGASRRSRPA